MAIFNQCIINKINNKNNIIIIIIIVIIIIITIIIIIIIIIIFQSSPKKPGQCTNQPHNTETLWTQGQVLIFQCPC